MRFLTVAFVLSVLVSGNHVHAKSQVNTKGKVYSDDAINARKESKLSSEDTVADADEVRKGGKVTSKDAVAACNLRGGNNSRKEDKGNGNSDDDESATGYRIRGSNGDKVKWEDANKAVKRFQQDLKKGNPDRALRKLMRTMASTNFVPELMITSPKTPPRKLKYESEMTDIGIINPFHSTIVYELLDGGHVELRPPAFGETHNFSPENAYRFLQVSKLM